MKSQRATLGLAVLACTTRCPLITRAAVKAEHGPQHARREQLNDAISNAQALLDALLDARTKLGWNQDGAAA